MAGAGHADADRIQVAVASNFAATLAVIVDGYEQRSGHEVVLVPGSTGKHYAQIRNGAPFDAFFAADVRRPELLEQSGAAIAGSRFTYALGRLVLWSPAPGLVEPSGRVLESGSFRHLAIANPRLAPYGAAARRALRSLGLWDALQDELVYGENIGQAFHFVNSGNAELGLVALSQIIRAGHDARDEPAQGGFWELPRSLYGPIEQQAVALTNGEPTRAFLTYVRSNEGLAIIRDSGYGAP